MKKLILLITAVILSHTFVLSQACLCGGITFTSQSQIDNFQADNPGCMEIGGDVTIYGSGITNLSGFSVLTSIGGNLNIGSFENGGIPRLTSLTGLNNLTSIGGNLGIKYNDALSSLTGLDRLNSIGGYLSIGWNALTSLTGMEGLAFIEGDLEIRNNYNLTSLTGLDNVTFIGGFIFIDNNIALNSLSGLQNLTSIAGDLYIGNNYLLTALSGMDNVTSIGGDLYIYFNGSLTSLTGLEGLTSIGSIILQGNDALFSLTGLDNVTSITGSLWIGGINPQSSNSALTSLTGLNNLTSIGGDLGIKYNDALTSLEGLNNITSIGGKLSIYSNNQLTSLTSLENIDAGSIEGLEISYNNSLSDCDAKSICNYLSSPNGIIKISNNAAGCSSPDEMKIVCNPGAVEDVSFEEGFTVFPNPFGNSTIIEYQLPENAPVTLTIFNQLGQKVGMLVNEKQSQGIQQVQLNAENLKAGIYFCVLRINDGIQTKKIIKL